ncbi:hypothetical protein CYMTET_54202 [Cymbomonas tetramitiformis]|uniref:Uncharacterized protein n=1 Tax=Cymbomonas tetramitiformis TaxID=36881 RepID=A0AAE0ENZ2_9CHLO|nr:hypothetical protein CYMTET_54202 [Cymbomonas tetramitiformis]
MNIGAGDCQMDEGPAVAALPVGTLVDVYWPGDDRGWDGNERGEAWPPHLSIRLELLGFGGEGADLGVVLASGGGGAGGAEAMRMAGGGVQEVGLGTATVGAERGADAAWLLSGPLVLVFPKD